MFFERRPLRQKLGAAKQQRDGLAIRSEHKLDDPSMNLPV
jgi:hypothetical protein